MTAAGYVTVSSVLESQRWNWLEVSTSRRMFGDRSFVIDRPRVWNSLDTGIISWPFIVITVFTNQLKTHLFIQ